MANKVSSIAKTEDSSVGVQGSQSTGKSWARYDATTDTYESMELTANPNKYSDVSSENQELVNYVSNNGYMVGTSPDTFDPNGTMTRAQMVQILYAMEGKPSVGKANFSDVKGDAWYSDAVAWAQKEGIVAGHTDGTFRPDDTITREQMAAIMKKYAEHNGKQVSGHTSAKNFDDSKNISGYAVEAISWGLDAGMMDASLGNIRPKDNATRLEMAKMIKAYDDTYTKEAYTETVDMSHETYLNTHGNINETPTTKYKDVSSANAETVNYVSDRGIMVGNGTDKFNPDQTLTRAQFVQTLYAMSGKPYTGENNTFKDVNDGSTYSDAITWAQNTGLVAGNTDGTFRPNDTITKEQMAAILKKYGELSNKDLGTYNVQSINTFSDAGSASNYAKDSLAWASQNNIISSNGNSLNPKADVTRMDLANALKAFDENYNNGAGKNNTMVAAKTNPVKKVNDQQILSSIQTRFNGLSGGNYNHRCGQLTCDQLAVQGLIGDGDRVGSGCDQARAIARGGKTSTGYKVYGYEMNSQNARTQFEQMIADNGGSVDNVVVSFAANTGCLGPHGHVCLISKIENGNVYLIDDTSFTTNSSGNRVATKMSVSDFESNYFGKIGSPNYMAVVSNQRA